MRKNLATILYGLLTIYWTFILIYRGADWGMVLLLAVGSLMFGANLQKRWGDNGKAGE